MHKTSTKNYRLSRVKSQNTKLEIQFFSIIKNTFKIPFETHVNYLPGKPDIVFNKLKICIFLDSDFWHGWQYPRWKKKLKSQYWQEKIEATRKRDIKVSRKLKYRGWTVLRVWEHSLNLSHEGFLKKINQALERSNEFCPPEKI